MTKDVICGELQALIQKLAGWEYWHRSAGNTALADELKATRNKCMDYYNALKAMTWPA